MANIQFRPNKGKKITDYSKPQIIYLRYVLGRKIDFNASTGFRVMVDENPKRSDWDFEKQRVKDRTHISNRHEINNLIKKLTRYFEDFDNKNREKGYTPTYAEVRAHFDSYFKDGEEITIKQPDFMEYVEKFISDAKTKSNHTTGKPVKPLTIRSYGTTKKVLKEYIEDRGKIDFDTIDLDWYYDFVEFCSEKGYSLNYTGKHIKNVKAFLNNAQEDGLPVNGQFKSRRFKVLKEEADNIYLTLSELDKMWKLDLSHMPRHEKARDLFLIGAFTGLRVSDFNTLTPENFKVVNGQKRIVKKTVKTEEEVVIPLHPIVDSILKKNDGKPPESIPDQHINNLIKEVAENAGIDEVEYIERTVGGKKVEYKKRRFELVHSHTARRSFCTNAYLMGMPTIDLMQISGHRTESAFMKYIKVTKEQVAERMSLHPFFNGSHLKVV